MNRAVLTVNSGSSSLKASFFSEDGARCDFRYAHVLSQQKAFDQLLLDLGSNRPSVVGHRFVHGGEITEAVRVVDEIELSRLEGLVHLAPLHMPGNLLGLNLCLERFPVPQAACFDTAFHNTMPEISRRLPIPKELNLRRFGFHGLNYAYVAKKLPEMLGALARGKIVVAHLGSGASLCLMENLKSVDTSMGYTPAGGIVMGTRSGDLDPGVIVELAKSHGYEALSNMVYNKMGLIALSDGESSEMKILLSSKNENGQFATAYFCRQARAAIGSFAAKAGGIDALVFSGGIGERSPEVRAAICDPLNFMGFEIDKDANKENRTRVSQVISKPILVIPADEESIIRDLSLECIERAV
jgi:acetate kinase